MAYDDQEDLFNEEFDFVDEDDEVPEEGANDPAGSSEEDSDSQGEDEEKTAPKKPRRQRGAKRGRAKDQQAEQGEDDATAKDPEKGETKEGDAEKKEEAPPAPPPPPTDFVVHVYSNSKFSRTIGREFTSEDAEAFATEYNRTSSPYGRVAVAGSKDDQPAESWDKPLG